MQIWEIDPTTSVVEGLLEDGSPDPAYADALGLVTAPIGRRAAAAAVDIGLWLVIQIPFWTMTAGLLLKFLTGKITWYGFTNHPDFVKAMLFGGLTALLSVVFCVAQTALQARRGVTLGKAIFGLRSVNVATLARPGFGRILLRSLVVWGPSFIPLWTAAFLFSPTLDKTGRGRGWHDNVGRTWLVDVRTGLHPYDEKRMRVARKTVAATPRVERSPLRSLMGTDGAPQLQDFRPRERLSAGVLGDSALTPRPHVAPPTPSAPATPAASTPTGGALATAASATPTATPTPAATPAPTPTASPAPAPTPAAPTRFVLHFDTGQVVPVDGPLMLGRNPEPTEDGMATVVITDEMFSVSKTHLSVRPSAQGLEVTDWGSSNGTTLVRQGAQHRLAPGQAVLAQTGDTLQVGERTAQVGLA